ncbi:MFS transporter [Dasania marina]|uniref:MFS transporter n=1 Tax=Dasania marina TaxID=471499 RepID=UPI0030D6EE2D|tara:strand:+ start:25216 stop:26394 length:1179 start_codon:yes stop_codon:yes gene_type:complete
MVNTTSLQNNDKNYDMSYGISGIITAPIGYAVLLFLPIYLEVAAATLGLSERQVGLFAATDACGLALATLLFSLWVKKLNFHTVSLAGVVITVAGNLLSAVVQDFTLLCLIRVITGIGEGLLVAVGVCAVGMTANTNRWFGIYTAVIVAVQAVGLLIVPLAYESWQLSGVFLLMAAFYALPLLFIKKLPRAAAENEGVGEPSITPSAPVAARYIILALLGLLLFYVCIGGVWAYLSFMATDSGLTLAYVSKTLSIALLGGLSGAVFFALLGKWGARHSLLFVSSLILIACLWLFNDIQKGMFFIVTLLVFNFFWSVIGARLFALISDADKTGKYISAAQTVVGLGFVLGPIIGSLLVTDYGYFGINAMAILSMALCFIAVTPLALLTKRSIS